MWKNNLLKNKSLSKKFPKIIFVVEITLKHYLSNNFQVSFDIPKPKYFGQSQNSFGQIGSFTVLTVPTVLLNHDGAKWLGKQAKKRRQGQSHCT